MSIPTHPLSDPTANVKRMQVAQPTTPDQWASFIEMILQFAGQIVPIIIDIIDAAGGAVMSVFVPGTGTNTVQNPT